MNSLGGKVDIIPFLYCLLAVVVQFKVSRFDSFVYSEAWSHCSRLKSAGLTPLFIVRHGLTVQLIVFRGLFLAVLHTAPLFIVRHGLTVQLIVFRGLFLAVLHTAPLFIVRHGLTVQLIVFRGLFSYQLKVFVDCSYAALHTALREFIVSPETCCSHSFPGIYSLP